MLHSLSTIAAQTATSFAYNRITQAVVLQDGPPSLNGIKAHSCPTSLLFLAEWCFVSIIPFEKPRKFFVPGRQHPAVLSWPSCHKMYTLSYIINTVVII